MDQGVTLKIDGRDIVVPAGTTVLKAAQQAGIEIPSLCHQEKLLPAGLCRLCLVEIEKARGLQPACSTPVREGMVVHTDTAPVLHNRRMVLELLCTNHPLDCPVCDAAGDCRLQDYVFRYGRGETRFIEEKRHKGKALPVGPIVVLDQERCVLCQRCARFCEEVLDDRQLAVFQRGATSRINTFPGRQLDSRFSGNVVDLCPVGALTSRVARFQARNWELKPVESTCALCPVGCSLTSDVRGKRLVRQRGRDNAAVNGSWLCDLGRTAHAITEHADRLRQPLLRKNGALQPVNWDEALAAAAAGLNGLDGHVAALGSGRMTNEAAYLLSKLVRGVLGSNSVDVRQDCALPAPAQMAMSDLRRADVIVLFQGDPSEEAPILELWVKEAVRRGGKVFILNARRIALAAYATRNITPRPGTEAVFAAGVLAAVAADKVPAVWREALVNSGPAQTASLTGCAPDDPAAIVAALAGAQRGVLAYGAGVRDDAAVALLAALAAATNARLLGWGDGANTRGAADMGLRPDRLPGHAALDDVEAQARCKAAWGQTAPGQAGIASAELAQAAKKGDARALLLVQADPISEALNRQAAREMLASVRFKVAIDSFVTPSAALADVVFPAAVPGEEDGSLTNLAGDVAWERAAVAPLGEARPAWRILADLARALGANNSWVYVGAADVLAEAGQVVPAYAGAAAARAGKPCAARFDFALAAEGTVAPKPLANAGEGGLALVIGPALFDRDVVAAHAPAVAARAAEPSVSLNPADAQRLGIADGQQVIVRAGGNELRLRAAVSDTVPAGVAAAPLQMAAEGINILGLAVDRVTRVVVSPAPVEGR